MMGRDRWTGCQCRDQTWDPEGITIGLDDGINIGSLDVSFDGSNDGRFEVIGTTTD